jgi:outer membrane protein assembly factor BamB
MPRSTVLAVLVLSPLSVTVFADNWPGWRGPSGNGVTAEPNLPVRWSATENVVWRAPLPGLGVSTPVVWDDRVFVTSQSGVGARRPGDHPTLVQGDAATTSGERTLASRSAAPPSGDSVTFIVSAHRWSDGSQVWRHETAAEGPLPGVHDKHNLATASPVTDGQLVVGWFGTGQVVALDAGTGRALWTRHLGREYGPFEINWGHASSPVLSGDLAVFLAYHERRAYLLALDKRTGHIRWKRDRTPSAHSYSTPLVVSHEGRSVLIVNSSFGMEAYDAATGDPLWHVAETNRFPIPMAVHHDGVLYTSRGYRSSPYLAIRLGGSGDVSSSHVLWKTATGAPYVSSIVFYDGLIYMATELGIVTCIDAATGQQVWRERIGGVFTASPVAGDGKIYLVSESGEVVVLKAGRTMEVLSRNTLDAHLVASPSISRGRLFLRGDGELIAVGPKGGT